MGAETQEQRTDRTHTRKRSRWALAVSVASLVLASAVFGLSLFWHDQTESQQEDASQQQAEAASRQVEANSQLVDFEDNYETQTKTVLNYGSTTITDVVFDINDNEYAKIPVLQPCVQAEVARVVDHKGYPNLFWTDASGVRWVKLPDNQAPTRQSQSRIGTPTFEAQLQTEKEPREVIIEPIPGC